MRNFKVEIKKQNIWEIVIEGINWKQVKLS